MALEPEYGFLVEARFVLRRDRAHGALATFVVGMHEAEHEGRLLNDGVILFFQRSADSVL